MAKVIKCAVKPKYPVGAKIYYRGDMANAEGCFVITDFVAEEWGKRYCLSEVGGRRLISVAEVMISDVDKGNGLTRFVTEEAYNTYRNQQIEALQAARSTGRGGDAENENK